MDRQRRFFLRYVLVFLDAVVIVASFFLAYAIRDQLVVFGLEELLGFEVYAPYLPVIVFAWLYLLRAFNNYQYLQGRRRVSLQRIFVNLIPVEIVGVAIMGTVLFLLRDTSFSRTFLLMYGVVNYLCLVIAKQLFLSYFYRLQRGKRYHRQALLLGHRNAVEQFQADARSIPELLFDITVEPRFVEQADQRLPSEQRQELFQHVLDYIQEHVVDEVVLAYNDIRLRDISDFVTDCNRMGIMVNVVLDLSELEAVESEIDAIGNFNVISFQSHRFSPVQRFAKHLLDYIIALAGGLILLVLLPFIALAIKLDSSGPVFFVQPRKGKNGRTFHLIKFRTMSSDAEQRKAELAARNQMKGHIFKIDHDPRITRVGRFLRKTSLDEFPQFLNVLKGDMSVVGTRPPTEEEFRLYEKHHRRRLSVQPGITGMWQVSGRNRINDFEEIVKLDTWYIDHWSFWLDLRIIFRTIPVLFSGQ